MDWERRKKLMVRLSIVAAGVIALFWGIWYWITGEVPVITETVIIPSLSYSLPLKISHWWDVLEAAIWTVILISLTTSDLTKEINKVGLWVGLVLGLVLGLVAKTFLQLLSTLFFCEWTKEEVCCNI